VGSAENAGAISGPSIPGHGRTGFLASLRHTTHTDVRSAENAGAISGPSIPGHGRTGFLASLRHTVHPWT